MSRVITGTGVDGAAFGVGADLAAARALGFAALAGAMGLGAFADDFLILATGFVASAGAFLAAGVAAFFALAELEVFLVALADALMCFAGMKRIFGNA